MNAITVDIKSILVKKGIGEFGSIKESVWGIFIGKEPDNPTNTITLYITPGTVEKQFNNDRHFYHSAFQIRVRASDYKKAYEKANKCISALDRFGNTTIDDMTYNNILMDDEPIPLPRDSQGRILFVVNGVAFRRKSV